MAEATLLLINSTTYQLRLTYQHQYQMEDWNFPGTIEPGQAARVAIGFEHGVYSMDDGGEATYSLDGGASDFTIQARAPGRVFDLQLKASGLENDGLPHPDESLGWMAGRELVFWISGNNQGYVLRHCWH